MKCKYHPDIISCAKCFICKENICHLCTVEKDDNVYCKICFDKKFKVPEKIVKPVIKEKDIKDQFNILAILSFSLGIAGLFFNLLAAIPAIILGLIARNQIKESGEKGSEFAILGLIFGIVFAVIWSTLICGYFSMIGTFGITLCAGLGSGGG